VQPVARPAAATAMEAIPDETEVVYRPGVKLEQVLALPYERTPLPTGCPPFDGAILEIDRQSSFCWHHVPLFQADLSMRIIQIEQEIRHGVIEKIVDSICPDIGLGCP